MDEKYIHISKEIYNTRKKEMSKKVDSIIQLVTSKDECRSSVILRYFGEKNTNNCGICDICVENNDLSVRIKQLQTMITKELINGALSIDDLSQELNSNKQMILKSIQLLLDEKEIILNEHQKFELK